MLFSFRFKNLKILLFLMFVGLSGFSAKLHAQATDGAMTFTVKTVTANGDFSPKHVLAIWVEDESGFVLTRKLRGDKRKQYLYTWNAASGADVTDATTGATLSSHQSHTVSWDCRNSNGELVEDGTYYVNVEFTDAHKQGPLKRISFTKGADPISLTPGDETNFVDMTLAFQPAATGLEVSHMDLTRIYPNPSNGILMIDLDGHVGTSTITIYEINGGFIYSRKLKGPGIHPVSLLDYEKGTYILQVESESKSSRAMIIRE